MDEHLLIFIQIFILKYLKFLGMTVPSYRGPALLNRTERRTEEEQFLHQGETPLLCSWACLPKAVVSDFTLISAEEVKTGIANEKV